MSELLRVSLRQLEYFVAVAEQGTMAAAAGRCLISQSAISLAVSQLERNLDVQLFLRQRSKGLTLTESGRRVLTDARRLLQQADELQATARNLGRELSGRLVVGCYSTLTPYLLPIALEAFKKAEPGIDIDFVEGSVAELHALLRSGACELALMFDIALEPDLVAATLYSVRPYVLLEAGHRLADRKAVRLADLAPEPMVMLDMPPSERYFLSMFAQAGVTPNVRMKTSSVEAVRALVASGAGYSVLLQRTAVMTSYTGRPFTTCEIEEYVSPVPIQLVHPAASRPTRRAEAFAAFCHRYLGATEGHAPGA
jgi:DNA-binding transcriptional LysR family regulator